MLGVVAVIAVGIGWWIRPQSCELRRADGTLEATLRVKRDWRGNYIACGEQAWFLRDGQCFRRQVIHGALLRERQFFGPGDYSSPVYPPHVPPDPPSAEYVAWLVRDRIPISTDLPRTAGESFSYP